MKKILLSVIFIFALAPFWVRADGGEVVVIYNTRMSESKAVADYYAEKRDVPKNQIYGFALTKNETMSREEFHDALQQPLLKKLESSGLWKFDKTSVVASKIRYAVLCYGVPLRIANDPNLRETVPTNVPELFHDNGASVDSELALLPMVKRNLPLAGPQKNWTYAVTNAAWLDPTNGILLVTRLDGPSADIARGEVDKALEAERDGLWGRAYFDARGLKKSDSGYYLGDEFILGAAQIARALGFETVVDDKPSTFSASFPMSQIALYAGWYDETVSGPFTLPKVEFMPGAFAYHLHSFSAATLRSATNNWCGPLLAKGATCTMGCVNEPSIQFTPNVALFLERWSIGRMTFGEAAWAAQTALSWQTTVVGDPLYRPFGKTPEELHAELARRKSPLIEWSFLRLVNAAALRGVSAERLIDYLENLSARTNSAVLTEKLADLCSDEGKPESAIDFYQQALKLNPSPEQKIRIRLALGEKLEEQKQFNAAFQDYKMLLEESPDYPGKPGIDDKLAALILKQAKQAAH